jgi:hypothetical protein
LRRKQWEQLEKAITEKNKATEDEAECSPQKNRRYTCRLFGTNSLKEGAM